MTGSEEFKFKVHTEMFSCPELDCPMNRLENSWSEGCGGCICYPCIKKRDKRRKVTQ